MIVLDSDKKEYMKKNKGLMTGIGMLLAGVGIYALIAYLIGMRVTYLGFLDSLGEGLSFLIKIGMVVIGFVIVFLAQTKLDPDA